MDQQILQTFVDEVAAEMPAIRRGVLVFAQHGGSSDDLALSLELTRTIKSGASMLELSDLERSSAALESAIAEFASHDSGLSGDHVAKILGLISGLEEAIIKVGLGSTDAGIAAFDDELSLEIPDDSWGEMVDETPSATAEEDGSGFEIDEELLEVFAMEAEGLLKNMHESLEIMSRNPQDRDALWEIRRNAHTFKGAAGIVGFKKPSELAHRVEDLLDRLAECESFSTIGIVDILSDSTQCLEAMTNGENSPQLHARIAAIYAQCDEVLAAVAVAPEVPVTSTEPEVPVITIPALEISETQPVEQPVLIAAAFNENRTSEMVELPRQSDRAQRRPIVRVSLSRLDELVRITRDLLVGRSVFEQRLRDLEQQIDELHNATRRLQNTSNRLEIDFEASMLSSPVGSRSVFGAFPEQSFGNTESFDELELDRYTNFHQCTRQLSEAASDTFEINNALDTVRGSFATLFDQQRTLVEELQERLVRIRMVEFGSLATRLQRVVTVTCEEENKKARFIIVNEKTELDTQILDALTEPLLHLLKNAVVHGIESPEARRMAGKPEIGEIRLTVASEETQVVITLSDDGRGIVPHALKRKAVDSGVIQQRQADEMSDEDAFGLIFCPGLTTAEKLNLSAGRGVGMSIVKESVEARKGSVSVMSVPQAGATFTLSLPLTLAIANVLLVKVGRQTIAIPTKSLSRISDVASSAVSVGSDGNASATLETGTVNLHYLAALTGQPVVPSVGNLTLLHLKAGDGEEMIVVDSVARTEEVIIKPLGRSLQNIKGVLGAALLGSGELVSILDLPHLIKNKMQPFTTVQTLPAERGGEITVMVVDDSPSVRLMTSKIIKNAGWLVMTAKDGIDALEQLSASGQLPNVILSDIEMPRMDGFELVASLQRNPTMSHIPVVMITSRSGSKHRDKALESGVSEYLSKPFDDHELVRAVTKLAAATVA